MTKQNQEKIEVFACCALPRGVTLSRRFYLIPLVGCVKSFYTIFVKIVKNEDELSEYVVIDFPNREKECDLKGET